MQPQQVRLAQRLTHAIAVGAALILGPPIAAKTQAEQVLGPQEEILEDGQIVTNILPGGDLTSRNLLVNPQNNESLDITRIDPRVPSVLAIVSHPDDELILAPVLSRIAREGGEVTLVFATSGDAGPGISALPKGDELAALRESEARCAAFALGLEDPIFWRFADGSLATKARSTSDQMRDLSERIAALIEVQEPKAILTWGPDGGYGHADHRMTSNAVTQVVQAMGLGRPDLLYAVIPGTADEEENVTGFEGWARLHPSLITDTIGYEVVDLNAAIAAVDCYQSQFDETTRRLLAGTLHERVWQGKVPFRLAFARQR